MPMSLLLPSGAGARPTWRCSACGSEAPHEAVQQVIESLSEEVENVVKSRLPRTLEKLIGRLVHPTGPLHPTSTVILNAKFHLMELYAARFHNSPSALTGRSLAGLLMVCRELLPVMDILAPKLTHDRGLVLRYLVSALTEKGRRKARNPASREEALAVLGEVEEHFLEVKRIFIEPWYQRILTNLEERVEELKALLAERR